MEAASGQADGPHQLGSGEATPSALSDEERAWIYQWLSGLFARELTTEALAAYRGPEGSALLQRLSAEPSLASIAERLQGLAADPQSDDAALLLFAGSFARLFLGVGGRRSAPPYESAYTSARGLLYQEATAESDGALKDLGLHVRQGFSEPSDHIAVQLEIMVALVRRADESEDRGEAAIGAKRQLDFIQARLLPWIESFRDDCIAADLSGFYAGAASGLVAFIAADTQRLRARLARRSVVYSPIT